MIRDEGSRLRAADGVEEVLQEVDRQLASVLCPGSQPNRSPKLKASKKRNRLGPPAGTVPNTSMHAFDEEEHIYSHLMYERLPATQHRQRSPGWFNARLGVVTASGVGALAGFFDTATCQALGLGTSLHRPAAAAQALEELRSRTRSDTQDSIPMRWGRAHEANPLLTLLEPGHRSSITIIKDLVPIKLRECSLVMVDVAKLPPSVTRGLSQQQLACLPPMGASPDAMLVGRDASGAEILMPVECKAPCPFQHCNGAGEATWVYVPNTSSWSTIPAHYYAQCQMTMLATGCDSMLLMRYLPEITTAYQVKRDDAWAHAPLAWLAAFNSFAIKAPTLVLAPCADPARKDLLQLSRADARRGAYVRVLGQVDSTNNQEASQPFLDQ